jgi:hypothetical protein
MPTNPLAAPQKRSRFTFKRAPQEVIDLLMNVKRENITARIMKEYISSTTISFVGMQEVTFKGAKFYYIGYYPVGASNAKNIEAMKERYRKTKKLYDLIEAEERARPGASSKWSYNNILGGQTPRSIRREYKNALKELERLHAQSRANIRYALILLGDYREQWTNALKDLTVVKSSLTRDALKNYIMEYWRFTEQGKVGHKRLQERNARAMFERAMMVQRRTNYGVYALLGGVHTSEGTFTRLMNVKMERILEYSKTPADRDASKHVGVELEASMPRNKWDDIKRELIKTGYANHMALGTDGSVTSDNTYKGGELRLCAPADKIENVVNAACEVLNRFGCKVDRSCGLHIHLDAREKTGVEGHQMFKNLVRQQKPLYLLQPASRRGNTYCKWTNLDDWGKSDRYLSINPEAFHKYQTIEVRLHSGTIAADKINHWIKLLSAIAYGKSAKTDYQTVEKLIGYFGEEIGGQAAQYFLDRAKKFEKTPAPVMSKNHEEYREFREDNDFESFPDEETPWNEVNVDLLNAANSNNQTAANF